MSELLEQPDGATDSDTGNLSSQTRCDNLEDLPSKFYDSCAKEGSWFFYPDKIRPYE
jgi:hypothetical protein